MVKGLAGVVLVLPTLLVLQGSNPPVKGFAELTTSGSPEGPFSTQ